MDVGPPEQRPLEACRFDGEAEAPPAPMTRIMYMECKAQGLAGGPARIGRVTFSRSRRTLYYRDQQLRRLPAGGYKANHYDVATGEAYWVSGPKRDGADRLYAERVEVHVDADVREEYWTDIRGLPHRARTPTPAGDPPRPTIVKVPLTVWVLRARRLGSQPGG